MKKKIFLGILIAIATICLFAVSVSAAVTIDDIQYDLSSNDSGNFATVSAANRGTCSIETVIIPETVEYDGKTYTVNKIADYAFAENTGIVNLVIMPKLARIPNSLVQASTSVKKVYIDFSNVTEIGNRALTFAVKDDSNPVAGEEFKLYTPESYLAGEDVEITEIDLPNVTSIGSGAFNNSSIKKVTIGKNCSFMGIQTFRFSDIEEITVLSNADIPAYFCGGTTNLKKLDSAVLHLSVAPLLPDAQTLPKFVLICQE